MNILYIFKHDPYGIGGGCVASLHYFLAFLEIYQNDSFDVVLNKEWVDHFPDELKIRCNLIPVPPRSFYNRFLSVFNGVMNRYQKTGEEMLLRRHYDICIFDHSDIAGTLVEIAKSRFTKTIVIHHNFEIDYFKDNHNTIMNLVFLRFVEKNENNAYHKCDYNIFLTKEDESQFVKRYGTSKSKSICRYVFEGNDNQCLPDGETQNNTIVISGSLSNVQNVDGINYFFSDIYENIPPNYKIVISGKDPSESLVKKINQYPNVLLVQNPVDMNEIIRKCSIFLCPTRLGSGIKVRITDGLRNGLPVIAHQISVRGYSSFVTEGFVYSFNDSSSFIKAFERLNNWIKDNPDYKKRIFSYYIQNCSFQKSVELIKASLSK